MVELLEAARAERLSTLLFTGLAWEEVQRLPLAPRRQLLEQPAKQIANYSRSSLIYDI